jgi:citrate lyase subunit beta / citryl-CoA lyase
MHPRQVLLGSQAASAALPVVDHYCGTPERWAKALALQAQLIEELGACVMDVTLDCEDGAPAGQEILHANSVLAGVNSAQAAIKNIAIRVAVRVHPVDHPAFADDVRIIVGGAGARLSHVMIPKVDSVADVQTAVQAINAAGQPGLPLHVLIESPLAVRNVFDIAAHPRVQSVSFGLLDFVSSHGGAIPESAMSAQGQFEHPLVMRAKLEIASACHAHGKTPSHCVVTEFKDTQALTHAAQRAVRELGFTRMWSIHPTQVRPILAAFAADDASLQLASQIVASAAAANWAPISFDGKLHDRASYRYFWQVLERAHQTGQNLPAIASPYFQGSPHV